MRPINKGDYPLDPATNQPKIFQNARLKIDTKYKEAGPYLKERIGSYCSYCERKVTSGLNVEHKLPKQPGAYPELRGSWDNFLLACSECNSTKGASMRSKWQFEEDKQPPISKIVLDYYCWPDQEDTFCLFSYGEGLVTVQSSLTSEVCGRAKCTLDLIGLSRLKSTDSRLAQIQQVLGKANHAKKCLEDSKGDPSGYARTLELILAQAEEAGCWSIWMAVFQDYKDFRAKLIDRFPGTRKDYFIEETVQTQQLISQNSPEAAQLVIGSPPYQKMDLKNRPPDPSSKTDKKSSSNFQNTNNTAQRRLGKGKKSNVRAARSGQQVKMPESFILGGSEAVQESAKASKHPRWKIKSKLKAKLRNKKHSKSRGKKR